MFYDKLNLSDGDIISAAHIHHIEEGIDRFNDEVNGFKKSLIDILNEKNIEANNTESFSDILQKFTYLKSPEVGKYTNKTVIDIRETVGSKQIQLVCKTTTVSFECTSDTGFKVEWGDGTTDEYTTFGTVNVVHTFANGSGQPYISGTNQIVCTIAPINGGKIISFKPTDGAKGSMLAFCAKDIFFSSLGDLFKDCVELRYIDIIGGSFGTIGVSTTMNYFCSGCSNLIRISGNVSWSSITEMTRTFDLCENLEVIDLGDSLDTKNVASFNNTFHGCSKIKTIPYFLTDSCINMEQCFKDCVLLERVNGDAWNLTNCTSMTKAFSDCTSLKAFPCFNNTDKVTNVYRMFYGCEALTSLNTNQHELNLNAATDVRELFMGCVSLEETVSRSV